MVKNMKKIRQMGILIKNKKFWINKTFNKIYKIFLKLEILISSVKSLKVIEYIIMCQIINL